jgi:lysophospholipase L1-like esterase
MKKRIFIKRYLSSPALEKRNIIFFLLLFLGTESLFAQSITVLSPNGGEKWEANSIQYITWESSGVSNIEIEFSLDNGYSWEIIESSYDATLESYSWKIIDAQTPDFLIRISDVLYPSVYDISDNTFSVYVVTSQKVLKESSGTQVKIMPLGDSITFGTDKADTVAKRGYRRELYQQLDNADYDIDFVGQLIAGFPEDFDRDHEGRGGWAAYKKLESQSLSHNLNSFLVANPPDVILLHIGTNDLGDPALDDDPLTLSYEVRDILDTINNFDSNIITFLARIINKAPNNPKFTSFNNHLQNRADSLIALGRKIVVVDMENGAGINYSIDITLPYNDGDFSDETHPNESGYIKMANEWFDELQNYFQPVLASPVNGADDQPINLTLTWNEPPADTDIVVVYDIEVAKDINFSEIVYTTSGISPNSVNPTGLLYGTQYYWRVKIPSYGWSDIFSFTTETLEVDVTLFLQGPYSTGNDTMTTALNPTYLPTNQPYNIAPWDYDGAESVSSGFFASNPNIVDWVLVELRTGTEPDSATTIDTTRAAFILNDGRIVDLDGSSFLNFSGILENNYYIAVHHRNHLAVMSNTSYSTSNIVHDFTTGSAKFHGGSAGAADLGSGVWGMIAGDANGDGIVNYSDPDNDRFSHFIITRRCSIIFFKWLL